MKRIVVIGGSVGAVVLLVTSMFPTVVGAQTTRSIEKSINSDIIVGEIFSKQKCILDYPPGWWLGVLWDFLLSLILWFSFNHPPS